MSRRAPLLATVAFGLLVTACGETTTRSEAAWIEIQAPDSVVLGQGFDLVVERGWKTGLTPDAFSDDALSPLLVRLEIDEETEGHTHTTQVRRYTAYAFEAGELVLPDLQIVARGADTDPVTATAEPMIIAVSGSVDPENAGAVELPGDLITGSDGLAWWLRLGGGAAVLLTIGWIMRSMRARRGQAAGLPVPQESAEVAIVPRPHLDALAQLRALATTLPEGQRDVDAFYVTASNIIRDYIATRFTVPALERTTEEFLADAARTEPALAAHRDTLRQFLAGSDLVKFGRHLPPQPAHQGHVATAVAFVEATSPNEEATPA